MHSIFHSFFTFTCLAAQSDRIRWKDYIVNLKTLTIFVLQSFSNRGAILLSLQRPRRKKKIKFSFTLNKERLDSVLIYFRAVTAPNPLIIVALWCCLAFQTFREVKRPPLWYCVSSSSRCALNIFACALNTLTHKTFFIFSLWAFKLLFTKPYFTASVQNLATSRSFNTTYAAWMKKN